MKYNSLGQYFYKLYTIIFILMLVPIGLFIFLYQGVRLGFLKSIEPDLNPQFILIGVISLAVFSWTISWLLISHRLKEVTKIGSLGEKLSRYASLTIVRNSAFSVGMLLLGAGYFFTQDSWMTIAFAISLLLPLLFWPSPKRVCKDLKLKGDELMMVLYRMDMF